MTQSFSVREDVGENLRDYYQSGPLDDGIDHRPSLTGATHVFKAGLVGEMSPNGIAE
jgi:hypothetical protein